MSEGKQVLNFFLNKKSYIWLKFGEGKGTLGSALPDASEFCAKASVTVCYVLAAVSVYSHVLSL